MNQETRQCQNCKNQFTIEPDDFDFYKKMNVPAPTFCPQCRLQRRLMFRNDRTFYKRPCGLCGKEIMTVFAPDKDKPCTVYCNPCWWSDKWDDSAYGQEYDPSRNFFEQFKELQLKVPHMPLMTSYLTLVNSDYVNYVGGLKNCYLMFNGDESENCLYIDKFVGLKDCMDGVSLQSSELCYENINCRKCYGVHFSEDCAGCHNTYFSKNCIGCNDCFGCVNLRNKTHYIFNKPHTEEEYDQRIREYKLSSYSSLEKIKKRAQDFWLQHPSKYMHGRQNTNASGDYIYNSKNTHDSYIVTGVEDSKFCSWINMPTTKDCYDYTEWGNNAQRVYDCMTVGEGADSIRFTFCSWALGTMDLEYSMFLVSCSNCFGSISMKKKKYCILNKQYSKEEHHKLRERILKDLEERPYIDSKGRAWKYGEFFPYDLSLFDYNETSANDYFPLDKSKAEEKNFRWHKKKEKEYTITKKSDELPDDITGIEDSILKEIIECGSCGKAFRIVKPELDLLRRFGFPLPRQCFECRHSRRISKMNPMRFYNRECAKCGISVRTAFAPDNLTIIYCEQCYQAEVV